MSIEQRLNKVEKALRRWRVTGFIVVCGLAFYGFAVDDVYERIATNQLVIVSDDGDVVAILGESGGGGYLRVTSNEGSGSASIRCSGDGGSLALFGGAGGLGLGMSGQTADAPFGSIAIYNGRPEDVLWFAPKTADE